MCLQITAESDVDTVFVSVRNAFDKLALKDANVVFVLGVLCSYAMLCSLLFLRLPSSSTVHSGSRFN